MTDKRTESRAAWQGLPSLQRQNNRTRAVLLHGTCICKTQLQGCDSDLAPARYLEHGCEVRTLWHREPVHNTGSLISPVAALIRWSDVISKYLRDLRTVFFFPVTAFAMLAVPSCLKKVASPAATKAARSGAYFRYASSSFSTRLTRQRRAQLRQDVAEQLRAVIDSSSP